MKMSYPARFSQLSHDPLSISHDSFAKVTQLGEPALLYGHESPYRITLPAKTDKLKKVYSQNWGKNLTDTLFWEGSLCLLTKTGSEAGGALW